MATFSSHPVEAGTAGQTVWRKIKDLLVTCESVEVVVTTTDDSESFELRAWTRVRKDGSNGPNPVPGAEY